MIFADFVAGFIKFFRFRPCTPRLIFSPLKYVKLGAFILLITSTASIFASVIAFLPFGFFFIVAMLISGTLLFSRMPATEAYLINNTTPGTRSTMLGIFTPILGGIIDALGFQLGFSIMAGFLGVLIAASLLLMRLTEKW